MALLMTAAIGSVVAIKRPHNPIGWLLQGTSLLALATEILRLWGESLIAPGAEPIVASTFLTSLAAQLWGYVIAQLILVFLWFPDGNALSPRWQRLPRVLLITITVSMVGLFLKTMWDTHWAPKGTIGDAGSTSLLVVSGIALAMVVLIWAASAVSLVLRFRRGTGDERHQIKWLAYPAALFTAFAIISPWVEQAIGDDSSWIGVGFAVLFLGIPVGTGIAVLRYRLYEIDVIINRTLVYGPMTAVLAGTFTGGIVFFRLIFVEMMGVSSDAAIATTTLAIAAIAMPVKNRIQSLVDRFFKEDERRRLATFESDLTKALDALHPPTMIGRFIRSVESIIGVPVQVVIETGSHRGTYPEDVSLSDVRRTVPITADDFTAGSVKLGGAPVGGFRDTDIARIESAAGQIARLVRMDAERA